MAYKQMKWNPKQRSTSSCIYRNGILKKRQTDRDRDKQTNRQTQTDRLMEY